MRHLSVGDKLAVGCMHLKLRSKVWVSSTWRVFETMRDDVTVYRAVLSDTIATSRVCLFKLVRTKLENQFLSSSALVTFQVLLSHMGSLVTILDSAVKERVHHHRKSYWTVLIHSEKKA